MSSSKGGRPIDPIWGFFSQKERNNKIVIECNSCKKIVSAKPYRMKEHFKKCNGQQAPALQLMEESSNIEQENLTPLCKKSKQNDCVEIQSPRIQSNVNDFVVKTNLKEKNELDEAVAKFFYSCNIPFLVSENPSFVKMINLLRPGYKPPKRKQLAGELLDKIHNQLQMEMEKKISGKKVSLLQDGWSNIHNEPVIANCIHTGTECMFYDSVNAGSEKKTANFCADVAKKAITEIERKYDCQVTSLVTDNENKMELMRTLIHEEMPSVSTYGCSAHYLNLLGQKITPDSVMKHVVSVQKYFRNHHRPGAWLKEYPKSVKPQIPCYTRWNSQADCLESFVKNRPYYLQILDEHEDDIDKAIIQIINNQMIFKEVKHLLLQTKPIAIALDLVQKENCTIADACDIWIDLTKEDNLMNTHEKEVTNRFKQAITDYHLLAYMLHPKYLGTKLSCAQEENARKLLADINPDFLPYVIALQNKSAPFPETYLSDLVLTTTPATTWWSSFKKCAIDENFTSLACSLMAMPASSAGIERIFSNFSFVHNKLRNCLGLETASKLVFCYKLLQSTNNVKFDFEW